MESCRARRRKCGRQAVRQIGGIVRFENASYGESRRGTLKGALWRCHSCDLRIGCITKKAVVAVVLIYRIGSGIVVAAGRRMVAHFQGGVSANAAVWVGSLRSMMEHMPTRGRHLKGHQSEDENQSQKTAHKARF